MKIFDGLNVFELVDYSANSMNSLPVVKIYVNKNTNVNTDLQVEGDQLKTVIKPKKQYLENGNHFRLHFKSIGDLVIYSKDTKEESLNKLNFLYQILEKTPNAFVRFEIGLSGDCVEGDASVETFNVVFAASINQWAVIKD